MVWSDAHAALNGTTNTFICMIFSPFINRRSARKHVAAPAVPARANTHRAPTDHAWETAFDFVKNIYWDGGWRARLSPHEALSFRAAAPFTVRCKPNRTDAVN
jgi:hypothetical protein